MFWERSDSALSDETLRGLRDLSTSGDAARDAAQAFMGACLVRPIGGGTFNHVWRAAPYTHWSTDDLDKIRVIRLNIHPAANSQASHLDQWVNNEAIARGFPTPRIVHVDTSRAHCPYPFQVIEYSHGVSLRSGDELTVLKVLSQLGAALAVLHARPVGDRYGRVGLGTVPEWDMFWAWNSWTHGGYCREHDLITDLQEAEIESYLYDVSLGCDSPALLHGDLSYDNILLDAKTLDLKSVIDWEDAVLGDPIFELAGLATFHPESRHAAFIDSYYAGRAKPDDFEYRFWVYYLRIALAKAVHRHRFGYVTNVVADHQNPDERISLALNHLKDL